MCLYDNDNILLCFVSVALCAWNSVFRCLCFMLLLIMMIMIKVMMTAMTLGATKRSRSKHFFDIEHSTLNLLKPYLRPYLRLVASCRP